MAGDPFASEYGVQGGLMESCRNSQEVSTGVAQVIESKSF